LQSGAKLGLIPSSMSAMVDLRGQLTGFRELFYVVLAEKERMITIFAFLHLENVFLFTRYMRKLGLLSLSIFSVILEMMKFINKILMR
jgi:hypothetical protein